MFEITGDVFVKMFKKFKKEVLFFAKRNCNFFGKSILFLNPFVAIFIVYFFNDFCIAAAESLILYILGNFLKEIANQYNYGDDLPRPIERYTKIGKNGEVSVDYKKMHEIVLFLAEYEDYLEKR